MAAIEEATPVESEFRCWDGVSQNSLTLALSPPVTRCVEVDLVDQRSRVMHGQRLLGHLSLMVTSKSVYRHPVGKAFIEAMACRTQLSEDLRERVYTAVQEALMNALMHGNLQIESGTRDSLESLMETHEKIEQKLASPQVACGMISVEAIWNYKMLHVLIRDSGTGFKKAELPAPEAWAEEGHFGSGRGISILEAICDRVVLLDGGSTIKLGFRL